MRRSEQNFDAMTGTAVKRQSRDRAAISIVEIYPRKQSVLTAWPNCPFQKNYCEEEFRLLNFVDALKSSGFFFGAGTPWLMYSKVCPGVTWLECLMEFVGSDASHRARIAFCRSRPFRRSGFSISRGARSDLAGER
jgi:hypothetical protein